MLPRIAMNKPVNTNLNSCATCAVRQRIDPVSVDLGHLNAHAEL